MSKACTIYPNRISIYYPRNNDNWTETLLDKKINKYYKNYKSESLKNLNKKKSSLKLSKASRKNIKDTIQLLYQLAKPKTIRISKTKTIYNYKCSFITLTLPYKQHHTDKEVKICLNTFLQNLRKVYDLKNYVWVSELQQNKNIHFHLVIDKYINHNAIRYYWNLAINKLGYIDKYSNKFKDLSITEYARIRNLKVEECKAAFAFGKKTNWRSPSTEQVISVLSAQKLSGYLAKYLSKGITDTEDDKERAKTWGRSWGRSQSLSKIKLVTRWNWNNIKQIVTSFKGAKNMFYKKTYDWAEIWYFNFKALNSEFKGFLNNIFHDIGITYGYEAG